MKAAEKYFTVEEARRALPYIKQIARDILNSSDEDKMPFEERYDDTTESYVLVPNPTLQIVRLISELEEIGCHYKSGFKGLVQVDFPSVLDGRKVLLCWRSDEGDISCYHEINQGYSGRKQLPVYN